MYHTLHRMRPSHILGIKIAMVLLHMKIICVLLVYYMSATMRYATSYVYNTPIKYAVIISSSNPMYNPQ